MFIIAYLQDMVYFHTKIALLCGSECVFQIGNIEQTVWANYTERCRNIDEKPKNRYSSRQSELYGFLEQDCFITKLGARVFSCIT